MSWQFGKRSDGQFFAQYGIRWTHTFSVSWQVSGGWLVLDGLTHMSGASSGMPRSSFLHVLSHLQGRWPMFSHLGGELQEVIMQAASERLGHGSPTVLLLPCYTGQTESQGQPRFKGEKNRLHLFIGDSNNSWSRLMHQECQYILVDHPFFGNKRVSIELISIRKYTWCVPFCSLSFCIWESNWDRNFGKVMNIYNELNYNPLNP